MADPFGGTSPSELKLPRPKTGGQRSLEQVLARRRSVRTLGGPALRDVELSQLLWAAQGVSDSWGHRTAPSAGGTYPLEVSVALAQGVYHYEPVRHRLERRVDLDVRRHLAQVALQQSVLADAPAVFVVSSVARRTAQRYGAERSMRYVLLEAGHAAQNLLLMAVALELGAVVIGAFHDARVHETLGLAQGEEPLYLIPVGRPGK
jgi:SagB-type dehydrogenase family enzyme